MAESKNEAKNIWLKLWVLETALMACFGNSVLNQMNITQKKLHSVNSDLLILIEL
jgi:hypothetical protein